MKIGILGGSFDPIHKGHLALARESQTEFHLDKILFIPVSHPPHKEKNLTLTPAPMRARMVELAIQEEPTWELSDIELRRPGVSYTVDTFRELKRLYPHGTQFFFIAGADSFLDLKNWKEPNEIMKLAEWIVVPRLGYVLPEKLPARFHRLEILPIDVSATELRGKLEKGEDVSDWIPKKVYDYLKKMHLYRKMKT